MFDSPDSARGSRQGRGDRAALALLAERVRPVAASGIRLVPVAPALAGLLPDGALRRGSTLVVDGLSGAAALAVGLLGAASAAGSWCAAVGLCDLGMVAARDLGLDLDRFPLVPHPGPAWGEAVAVLVDGMDVVLLQPAFAPRPALARRLSARARDRGTVLVVLAGRAGWPEPPDLRLTVGGGGWGGIGDGAGHLRRRHLTVTATGRRSAARPRRDRIWLPSPTGGIEPVAPSADGARRGAGES